jgi:hypothetical protein
VRGEHPENLGCRSHLSISSRSTRYAGEILRVDGASARLRESRFWSHAGTACSLAERFDESNGVLNGVESFAEISPKGRLQGRRWLLRAIELISATPPAAKDNHQWAIKSGAPA